MPIPPTDVGIGISFASSAGSSQSRFPNQIATAAWTNALPSSRPIVNSRASVLTELAARTYSPVIDVHSGRGYRSADRSWTDREPWTEKRPSWSVTSQREIPPSSERPNVIAPGVNAASTMPPPTLRSDTLSVRISRRVPSARRGGKRPVRDAGHGRTNSRSARTPDSMLVSGDPRCSPTGIRALNQVAVGAESARPADWTSIRARPTTVAISLCTTGLLRIDLGQSTATALGHA